MQDKIYEKYLNEEVYVIHNGVADGHYIGATGRISDPKTATKYKTKEEAEEALEEYLKKNPHYVKNGLDSRITIEKI